MCVRNGNDKGAMEMLDFLDDCEEVGEYVDCLPGVYAPEILFFWFCAPPTDRRNVVDKPVKPLSDVSLKWGILAKLLIRALDQVVRFHAQHKTTVLTIHAV